MAEISIATWNINSVRLRQGLVERLMTEHAPDVICLQETKTPNANFPSGPFRKLGYEHQAIHGQKGYHGVAILSRLPLEEIVSRPFCDKEDARHVSARVALPSGPVVVHNLYVPAGGDEPDPEINPKFAHKLAFLDELNTFLSSGPAAEPSVVVGDLNIAPLVEDVWSHKQLLGVVSHTPIETEALERIRANGSWIDVMRERIPVPQRLYTWWSYRSADWSAADKGRRLDHVWASPHFAGGVGSVEVLREARGWEKPSDHVPVIARLSV